MFDYEEVCPISKAASILCERWTLQIVREMLFGASRFSDLQKYLPKMSPTLLNSRLKTLEQQGIIIRKRIPEKRGYEYFLTPSGLALKPVLESMGKWGIEWAFDQTDPEQLNLSVMVRDFAVTINTDELPAGDTVIQFTIPSRCDTTKKFVLIRNGTSQVCDENIGNEVDVYLTASLETLGKLWYGEIQLLDAMASGDLKAVGAPIYVNRISSWMGRSQFADIHEKKFKTC